MKNKQDKLNGYKQCYAVAIELDGDLLVGKEMGEELKSVLSKIGTTLRKYSYVGLQPMYKVLMCYFDMTAEKIAKEFVDDIKAQNIKGIVSIYPSDKSAYIDSRYLSGMYKEVQVTLPPPYLEERIVEILNEYCFDWEFTQEPLSDMLTYVGNLGGGRQIYFVVQHGNKRLAVGIDHSDLRTTDQVSNYYKKMLDDLENEIVEWCEDHPSICKTRLKA